MSKAKPAVRSGRAAARASGPEKNLNPHWVSVTPGTIARASARNVAAPDPAGGAAPVLDHRGLQRPRPDDRAGPGGEQSQRRVQGG